MGNKPNKTEPFMTDKKARVALIIGLLVLVPLALLDILPPSLRETWIETALATVGMTSLFVGGAILWFWKG